MATAVEQLQALQYSVGQTSETEEDVEYTERVFFAEIQGRLHVEFYGCPFDENYEAFLLGLCTPQVAGSLQALTIRGPDEGSNGTRHWDLTALVESDALFPMLQSVFIEPTAPEHHNHSIIGGGYEEEGQIAKLLTRAPDLRSLIVPSAPAASFFQVGNRPLRYLRVETGYAHQDFLLNLSRSDCFTKLVTLDFGDFNERYVENHPDACSPFVYYEKLFLSNAFQGVRVFRLRNSILTQEQLAHLRSLRKDLQFRVIQTYGECLR